MNSIILRTEQSGTKKYSELPYEELQQLFHARIGNCTEQPTTDNFDLLLPDTDFLQDFQPISENTSMPYSQMFREFVHKGPNSMGYDEAFVNIVTNIADNMSAKLYRCFESYQTNISNAILSTMNDLIDAAEACRGQEGQEYFYMHKLGATTIVPQKGEPRVIKYDDQLDFIIQCLAFLMDPVQYAMSDVEMIYFANFDELAKIDNTLLFCYDKLLKQ